MVDSFCLNCEFNIVKIKDAHHNMSIFPTCKLRTISPISHNISHNSLSYSQSLVIVSPTRINSCNPVHQVPVSFILWSYLARCFKSRSNLHYIRPSVKIRYSNIPNTSRAERMALLERTLILKSSFKRLAFLLGDIYAPNTSNKG